MFCNWGFAIIVMFILILYGTIFVDIIIVSVPEEKINQYNFLSVMLKAHIPKTAALHIT